MPIHTCTGEPRMKSLLWEASRQSGIPNPGATSLTDNFIMALIIIYHFTLVNLS